MTYTNMTVALLMAFILPMQADEKKPPEVPLEHQLDFANAETAVANANSALQKAQLRLQEVVNTVLKDCPDPWVPQKGADTGRITCVEKPKDPPPPPPAKK